MAMFVTTDGYTLYRTASECGSYYVWRDSPYPDFDLEFVEQNCRPVDHNNVPLDGTFTPTETKEALLRDALAYEAEAFEDDEEINGGDLVDWFAAWRRRVRASLS
jgi:hypothetical protein